MHYSILLTQLIHELQQIEGRKKLQKIVHILQSAGAPFEERFEYAHFGPYSATLRAEIDSLCEYRYISELQIGVSYEFKPGEEFVKIADEDFLSNSPDWATFAKVLNEKSPRELESLSTVIFLQDLGFDQGKLQEKFAELKAHLIQHFDWAWTMAVTISGLRADWTALPEAVQA